MAAHAGVVVEGNDVQVAAGSVGEAFFAPPTLKRRQSGKPDKPISHIGGPRIGKVRSPFTNIGKMTVAHALRFQDGVRDAMLSRKPVPADHFSTMLADILS